MSSGWPTTEYRDHAEALLPKKESTIKVLKGQDCQHCRFKGRPKPSDIADAILGWCPFLRVGYPSTNTCGWWRLKIKIYSVKEIYESRWSIPQNYGLAIDKPINE